MKKMFVFSISPRHQSCPIYGQNVGRAWHHTTDYKHTVSEQTRGNFKEKEKKKKKEKKNGENNMPPVKTNFINWRLKLIKLPAKIIHKRVWHLVIKTVVSEQ